MKQQNVLLSMARDHEKGLEQISSQLWLEEPGTLRRQLRNDLATQADLNRIKRSDEKVVTLSYRGEFTQLECQRIEFTSDSWMSFSLELERKQQGWSVRRFMYKLHPCESKHRGNPNSFKQRSLSRSSGNPPLPSSCRQQQASHTVS